MDSRFFAEMVEVIIGHDNEVLIRIDGQTLHVAWAEVVTVEKGINGSTRTSEVFHQHLANPPKGGLELRQKQHDLQLAEAMLTNFRREAGKAHKLRYRS